MDIRSTGFTVLLATTLSLLPLAACSGNRSPQPPPRDAGPSSGTGARAVTHEVSEPAENPSESVTVPDVGPPPEEIAEAPDAELPEEGESALDPESTLQLSLEAFEVAAELWQRGEVEQAYETLDRAYELMASVHPNGDAMVAQQKQDLRQLIAERVLQIRTSQGLTATELNASIPLVINEHVQAEIESFQGPERDNFLEGYRRSGLYRPMIVETLSAAGMPDQIGWLPMVESWFKVRAYSSARALGMWQFIASTGYRFGLERDWWIDERMDPVKSTQAAAAYLTELHRLFGDWLTALAAYNCGERAVLRAIEGQREDYLDQFWDIYTRLPHETRRFVPRFLAVLAIVNDPATYGFELPEPMPPLDYETTELERSIELTSIDQLLALESGTLEALNPELRRKATPDQPYTLKVPPGATPTLLARLDNMPEWAAPASLTTIYRVRSGDTLSGIAARYGATVASLMELNDLRSAHRIRQGQTLRVPDRTPGAGTVASLGGEVGYTVRSGDSLWSLAKRYDTTVDRIKRDNGLGGNTLQPGQHLTLRGGSAPGAVYVVRRGDTLGKIAQRQGVSLGSLMAMNGLSRRSIIYPGQRLILPN